MGTDALDTYALDLAQIVDAFTYELCEECGMDLDAHVILPVNGHPWVRCLREPELEPPTDEPCPDCRAEVGVPCTWDCSSRWT